MRVGRRVFLFCGLMSIMPLASAYCQSSPMVAVPTGISDASETQTPAQPGNPSRELLLAISMSDAESLGHLLEGGADANYADPSSGMTLLMMAQQPAVVRLLLQHGADPLALDQKGATVLHYAVMASRALDIIPLLVNRGADVNARDDKGISVLMQAVMNDKPELVGLILNLGADLQARTNEGQTALDWAQDLGFADIAAMLEDAAFDR